MLVGRDEQIGGALLVQLLVVALLASASRQKVPLPIGATPRARLEYHVARKGVAARSAQILVARLPVDVHHVAQMTDHLDPERIVIDELAVAGGPLLAEAAHVQLLVLHRHPLALEALAGRVAVAVAEYDPRYDLAVVRVHLVDDASAVVARVQLAVEDDELGELHAPLAVRVLRAQLHRVDVEVDLSDAQVLADDQLALEHVALVLAVALALLRVGVQVGDGHPRVGERLVLATAHRRRQRIRVVVGDRVVVDAVDAIRVVEVVRGRVVVDAEALVGHQHVEQHEQREQDNGHGREFGVEVEIYTRVNTIANRLSDRRHPILSHCPSDLLCYPPHF